MHIVVFGVGAVGGFFGSMLAKYANSENNQHRLRMSFIARGKTLEALQNQGIKLQAESEEINEQVHAYESFKELAKANLDPVDVVLLCVKSKDTLDAAEAIKPYLSKSAYVVSIQNGVENEERLANLLGIERVIACLTNIAAMNKDPGEYLQTGAYSIIFGELPENQKNYTNDSKLAKFSLIEASNQRLEKLLEVFKAANINASISEDVCLDMWTKLVWNAGINPISALHKLEIGPLFANEEYKKIILGIMEETKQVAHALGIMIRDDVAEYQFNRTNVPAWENFKTSMLQDVLAGKEIELDDLLGVVIRHASKKGIKTPYSQGIYDALKSGAYLEMC